MKITDKVYKTIKKYDMLKDGDTVLAGLSGGADSVCLLLCLKELGYDVSAIHVNHNIRGEEALRDVRFCEKLCEKLGVDLHVSSIDVFSYCESNHLSVEEGARELRYKEFSLYSKGKIATAHNINDCLETTVFNLARGTGLKGLVSIPPKRGDIIRPLIEVTRFEIEEYLNSVGQGFVTDSTNLTDEYTRNKIRHNVIPALISLNNSLYNSYQATRSFLYDDNDYLETKARELFDLSSADKKTYDTHILRNAHNAVSSRAVMMMLEENNIEVSSYRIRKTLEVIKTGGKYNISGNTYVLADDKCVRISAGHVKAESFTKQIIPPCRVPFFGKELVIGISHGFKYYKGVYKDHDGHIADLHKISGALTLRNRRDGDRIRLAGREFTSRLKTLFNENIPLNERDRKAIITDDSGLIYVEGFGICERVKVDENTRDILIIKIS